MTKQKHRYRRKPKQVIAEEWPVAVMDRDTLLQRVRYEGSAEHKSYPSFAGHPRLRSDASPCPTTVTRDQAQAVLEKAIQKGCISEVHEDGFPRYVWGRLDGRLYQARLINREQGWYKAWPIEDEAAEGPRDARGRLQQEAWDD